MINYTDVLEHFEYQDNGTLKWKTKGGRHNIGDIAGCIDVNGYVVLRFKGGIHRVHRIIWLYHTGTHPNGPIDHLNHIKDDNRIENLREASPLDNARNRKMSMLNKSGFTGVSWNKRAKRWFSQIKVDYKVIHLGSFKSKDDAITARKEANIKHGFHENHGKNIGENK